MTDLLDEVKRMSAELGLDLSFDADVSLAHYRRGEPLLLKELKTMEDGEVVWATYVEDGEDDYRIDGAYRIEKSGDTWVLDDGSCGGCDFSPYRESKDDEQCFDASGGHMYLWKVVS